MKRTSSLLEPHGVVTKKRSKTTLNDSLMSLPDDPRDLQGVIVYDNEDALEAARFHDYNLADSLDSALLRLKSGGYHLIPGIENDIKAFNHEHYLSILKAVTNLQEASASQGGGNAVVDEKEEGECSEDDHDGEQLEDGECAADEDGSGYKLVYTDQPKVPQPIQHIAPKRKTHSRRPVKEQAAKLQKIEANARGGWAIALAKGNHYVAQSLKQLAKKIRASDVFKSLQFVSVEHSALNSTGWNGSMMRGTQLKAWTDSFDDGSIKEEVKKFFPVYFRNKPTMLLDKEGRCFAYRTETVRFLEGQETPFYDAVVRLAGAIMNSEEHRLAAEDLVRGKHMALILGTHRQHAPKPKVCLWHRKNDTLVDEFIKTEIMAKTTRFVCRTLEVIFPGVAKRFRESAAYMKMTPYFGLYWNLCINGMFKGQKRIFCHPHLDWKNIVGVCALLVYQLPGYKFNHARRCWLVLWEAGIAIQMPPWTVLFYPSSLIHHFNVDITDFEFVTTSLDVTKPTKENSVPITEGDGDGRASFVYFNQASMYSGETGYPTLGKAEEADGKLAAMTDGAHDIREAFTCIAPVSLFDNDFDL